MKKFFSIFLIIFVFAGLVSCASEEPVNEGDNSVEEGTDNNDDDSTTNLDPETRYGNLYDEIASGNNHYEIKYSSFDDEVKNFEMDLVWVASSLECKNYGDTGLSLYYEVVDGIFTTYYPEFATNGTPTGDYVVSSKSFASQEDATMYILTLMLFDHVVDEALSKEEFVDAFIDGQIVLDNGWEYDLEITLDDDNHLQQIKRLQYYENNGVTEVSILQFDFTWNTNLSIDVPEINN